MIFQDLLALSRMLQNSYLVVNISAAKDREVLYIDTGLVQNLEGRVVLAHTALRRSKDSPIDFRKQLRCRRYRVRYSFP